MRRIAVTHIKGGTGKTTTTVNLAACLAEAGGRVMVVDLDAGAHSTRWLGADPSSPVLTELLTGEREGGLEAIAQPVEGVDGLFIVPASPDLANVERELVADTALKDAVSELRGFDYVLCDTCGGLNGLGTVARNVYVAASELLIPVAVRSLDLDGTADLMRLIDSVKRGLNRRLKVAGVVACRVDVRNNHSLAVVEKLRERFGPQMFQTVIHENIRLAEAHSYSQPITLYDPISRGAADYRALAEEVINQE